MTAFSRFHLNSSSRKAIAGWVMATDDVMPAAETHHRRFSGARIFASR